MACPTITLTGVTRDVWTCLRQRASALGITLPQESGTVRHPEADAEYTWDEDTSVLTVTFTRTPTWIGCNAIESRVRHAVVGCGAG